MVGWDDSARKKLVPRVVEELVWGLEWLVLEVHSRRGELVLQIQSSVLNIVVPAKLVHEHAVVAWVVHTRLWLRIETSSSNSQELGLGGKH